MAKINIKNSVRNPLITFLKENGLTFRTTDRKGNGFQVVEKIIISVSRQETKQQIMDIIADYGTQVYHDTTFRDHMSLDNVFVYSSNDYEKATDAASELELPNFYLENVNEQNSQHQELKALGSNLVSKQYINNITDRQGTLIERTQAQIMKFKNIVFGNGYSPSRSISNMGEFPYRNDVYVTSENNQGTLGMLLKRLSFQEEILGGLLTEEQSTDVQLDVNGEETTVPVKDVISVLMNNSLELNIEDKLVFGNPKQNSNFMINNFKKNIILGYLRGNFAGHLLSFADMYNAVESKRETLVYKVDKFIDTDSQPVQSFWMFDDNKYHDYQIKRDKTYRYVLSNYCMIYGTQTTITDSKESTSSIEITMTSTPSYKYTVLDFDEASIKVSPKIPMPPFVRFYNENNEENSVKIYLSLKNGSKKDRFIAISEEDNQIINGVESKDGLYEFDYELQDGKFEVYRLTEKPKSYQDFDGSKILDVANKINTTDVIFKENVRPNKKYYFMFRSINTIGIPSNPSPVYEVELIKMASTSKVAVEVVRMEEERSILDKTFKSLLQIKPAFQQEVFDDQDEFVQELPTFKKKINDLTLGTATDKVWGKKFKIRVKSKDTGKIIDLNVKFNLIKDNIK